MNKLLKPKILLLALMAMLIISTGFRCKCSTPAEKELLKPVRLIWWGTYDSPGNFSEIISDYKRLHPHISVSYRQLRLQEFEAELLEALAEDRGPDIISLHNTWITKYLSKLEPLPAKTQMAYQSIQKTLGLKEEVVIEVKNNASITTSQLKESFLDVIYHDVVRNRKIYGLPLSVNTLVMFYNRDLFDNAGIPLPPADWQALQENIKRLTFQDQEGNLVQSGVALGGSENIDEAVDIISLLMMQNGAKMTSGSSVTFGLLPADSTDRTYNPGPEALRFYLDFASPAKEVYTWNDNFPSSADAFAEGRVAIIFGYQYLIPYLELKRGGKLNYGIAKIPQIQGRQKEINLAAYWVQTVSKKSANKNEAWDFIQFISQKKRAKKYLDKTGQGTALRSLIEEQLASDKLRVFADQLLTSQSWYKGDDPGVVANAFKNMIETVKNGGDLKKAISLAAQRIQQTYD